MSNDVARRVRIWIAIVITITLVGFLGEADRVGAAVVGWQHLMIAFAMVWVAIFWREPGELAVRTDPGTTEDRQDWLDRLGPVLVEEMARRACDLRRAGR